MKLKFIFKGKKVHDVGYRVLLLNKAMSLGVDNFNTFNTSIDGIQTVIAIIEAGAESIEEFKVFVNTTMPEGAELDEISFDEYKNAIPPIERCMQAFQMEHWGKGIPILVKMLETQEKMLGNQDQMLGKQDQMLGKQDQMLGKQDQILGKQDQTITTIKEEGDKIRGAISDHMSQDVAELRDEISHIKTTMAKIASKVGVAV